MPLLGFFMGVSVRRERVGRAGFLDFSLNRLRGKKGYSVEGVFVLWHFCIKGCRRKRGSLKLPGISDEPGLLKISVLLRLCEGVLTSAGRFRSAAGNMTSAGP